jgi:hypothetical protein
VTTTPQSIGLLSARGSTAIDGRCRRADFADATIAAQQIEAFMLTYNTQMAHPFDWKKGVRFYKRWKRQDRRSFGSFSWPHN